jgi:Methylmalonyl Co-A mutase-associated GTPase MeaB
LNPIRMFRDSKSENSSSSGGRAAASGIGYQARVGAYFCVKILAESEAAPLWGLNHQEILETIAFETNNQIDDLLIRTSHGRRVFLNVKRRLVNSASEGSDFANAIDQMVRQFLETPGSDLANDRLVLVTSTDSSKAISTHLHNLLARIRNSAASQPLAELARNDDEQKLLGTLGEHVDKFWKRRSGASPSEEEVKRFLESVWLELLDVDEHGRDEQTAQTWLNSLVLENDEGKAAWNELVKFCLTLVSQGGSADRKRLQAELLGVGSKLKDSKTYRRDIDKLQALTKRTFQSIRTFSVIRVGEQEIKITRPVMTALMNAAETGSVVVTGDPGSGKSAVLYELVADLRDRGRDVVFFAVDRVEASTKAAFHQEFRLENDFHEILENWNGDEPAYLIIDALDASRNHSKTKFMNRLLADVQAKPGRWKVIVSIRKFDLRNNPILQQLFSGRIENKEYSSAAFPNLRHLNVPGLSVEEWLQIPRQNSEFGELYLEANNQLRELLFVPFNLRLLGELFAEGIRAGELSPIRTQIELLERYWNARIIGSDLGGDSRESILTKSVLLMVKNRLMQVNRREVIDTATANSLGEILSEGVLAEWPTADERTERSILTFSHHVIFDYAVARLYLRGIREEFIKKFESDPELILAIRPSITLHFQYELLKDVSSFWQLVFSFVRSEKIRAIGKLIGTSVAVGSAEGIAFFRPFFDLLTSSDQAAKQVGEQTLTHIARELRVKTAESPGFLFRNGEQLWTLFLEELSKNLSSLVAHNIRYVLWGSISQVKDFTDDQLCQLGTVSRRLLDFAFVSPIFDSLLANSSITFVCLTFASDKEASAETLRRVLEPTRVTEHGHNELTVFADHIETLTEADPFLVEEIYRAAFTNSDHSQERTSVSHSRIMNMTSTREQDFRMMRFSLRHKYGRFLSLAPVKGLRALINAINVFVDEEYASRLERRRAWNLVGHLDDNEGQIHESFDFLGTEVRMKTDYSEFWDTGSNHGNSEVLEMLDIFTNYIEGLCAVEGNEEPISELFDLIAKENHNAVFWRKVLKCGTRFPNAIGHKLHCLAWSAPILTSQDTTRPIGNYLQTNFSNFTPSERELTEAAILAITNLGTNDNEKEYLLRDRNRLLGCLHEDHIVTPAAREILAGMKRENQIPSNERLFGSHWTSTEAYTEEMELKEHGVPLEEESSQFIKALYEPAASFAGRFMNEDPKLVNIKEILPDLRKLFEALGDSQDRNFHHLLVDYAWGYLAEACAAAAEADDIVDERDLLEFLKQVLLLASEQSVPEANEDCESSFDDFPSWTFPFTRGDAGKGLVRLARFESCASADLLSRIKYISLSDPVPAVRFHINTRLVSLYETAGDLMWEILEKICSEEGSSGVLNLFIDSSLRPLVPFHADRIFDLTKKVYERFRDSSKAVKIKQNCTVIFGQLAFQFEHSESWQMLERFINEPDAYLNEVRQIVMNAGETLNLGIGVPVDLQNDRVRLECFKRLEQICRKTHTAFQNLVATLTDKEFGDWTDDEKDSYRSLHVLTGFIITKVYFASGGAEHIRSGTDDKNTIALGNEERSQFWRESKGLLDAVAESGFADVTHRLVETLDFLLPYDPKGVFLTLGKAVRSGKQDGYQYESMAVSNIVRIVETVLGQYPYLLRENETCRLAMVEILDTFVDAGWEAAHRLTYRLEQIYR